MKRYGFRVLLVALIAAAFMQDAARSAEGPKVLWERTFADDGSSSALAVTAMPDGGMAVAGETRPSKGKSSVVWIRRLDKEGNTLWRRELQEFEYTWSLVIAALPGSRIAVAGVKDTGKWQEILITVRYLDAKGGEESQWTYQARNWRTTPKLAVYPDGGIAAAGSTDIPREGFTYKGGDDMAGRARIARFDSYGNLVWDRRFGTEHWVQAFAVAVRSDGELVVAGGEGHLGASIPWAVRVDAQGNIALKETYPKKKGGVAPRLIGFGFDDDVFLAFEKWQHVRALRLTRRDLYVHWDRGHKDIDIVPDTMAALPQGGVVIGGEVLGTGGWKSRKSKLVRLDGEGGLLWVKRYDDQETGITAMTLLAGGNLAVVGEKLRRPDDDRSGVAWVMKFAPN